MDESRTLRYRLRRRHIRERRLMLLVLFCFAVVLGLWLWYYFIYTRTPEYALRALTEGAAGRDSAAVERYVDLSRTLSHAYDDLTDDMLRYDAALTAENKEQYQTFYSVIKPQMTESVREVISGYLRTGEWTLPEGASLTKGRQLAVDFERFIERSQLRNIEFIRIESVKVKDTTAEAQAAIRDRVTDTPFSLRLRLERAPEGHWQVIRIDNYKLYLDTLATRQNQDIADYIAATYDIVTEFNEIFEQQRTRFTALTKRAKGRFEGNTAVELKNLLQNEVVPTLKERQEALDAVAIPRGAAYLANLRHTVTDLSIASWKHYIKGVTTDSVEEFNAAETLLKQAVDIDLRITDIIHHNTVSQARPEIP